MIRRIHGPFPQSRAGNRCYGAIIMRVFGIGDLHLSHAVDKPMDIFGPEWKDHVKRMAENWTRVLREEDLVLVPGDLSWAMRMDEAEEDLEWLHRLPGKKIVIRGNHDYWWGSISRLRDRLEGSSVWPLQNDSISEGKVVVGGTRLWSVPAIEKAYVDPLEEPEDSILPVTAGIDAAKEVRLHNEKIFRREMGRLESSLRSMKEREGLRIVMTHFPPTSESGIDTVVTELLERFKIDICVFGHLHSLNLSGGRTWDFVKNGIRYVLVSCDAVGFSPYFLIDI